MEKGSPGFDGKYSYIVGTIVGEKVTLCLENPNSGNNVKLELTRSDGALKGIRKGEEVVYTRME